jgi:ubiquinone/menaquinone biosynthesis C-methylase UbiE
LISKEKTACLVKECYRVLQPGGRFITFSLHSVEEVETTYRDAGLDWKVSCFRIKSDRWNATNGRKRSRAHTMIVCDKACADGTYLHQHPLNIPSGVLSEEEYLRLKEEADQVRDEVRTLQNCKNSQLVHDVYR